MSRLKDWKPGEYRISLKVITDNGTSVEYYVPHVDSAEGLAFLKLALALRGKGPDRDPEVGS